MTYGRASATSFPFYELWDTHNIFTVFAATNKAILYHLIIITFYRREQ